MLFLAVILMDILTGMEFDLFVPSFPELQSHFSLSPFWVEALLSVNFMGYCLGLFFVGLLADRYGNRWVIVSGLIAFVFGCLLCLLVDAYPVFLFGRLLQGLGIAAPATLSFIIISDRYALKQQQFYMAMLNGSMNIAVAVAPVLGSYLTLYFHWQGNFIALLFLGLVALFMTLKFVATSCVPHNQEETLVHGYAKIFQAKFLMLLIMSLVLICIPYWIFVGMSSLLYIKDLRVSLAHFGYYQGVLAFAFALGSIFFGLFIKTHKVNELYLLKFTNFIFMLSFIGVAYLAWSNTHQPILITLAMLVFVIGQIIPSVVLYPRCLSLMPQAKGRISALLQGSRLIITALSLELAGYFYNGTFQNIGVLIAAFILSSVFILLLVIRHYHSY